MLSRVAANLYWMGRYVERAENVARLLDVAYHLELDARALDGRSLASGSPIESVLAVLACRDAFERVHGKATRDRQRVIDFLTFNRSQGHSILAMLGRARENARASREALSGDAWNQLNTLYLGLKGRKARPELALSPLRFLERVKRGCILFGGLIESTLPRTEAYHFLQLGRHLERVNQIGRIMQITMPPLPAESPTAVDPMLSVHWSNVLRSCSAFEAYLQEYQDQVDPVSVVGFLILNSRFPRAIRYCVERCGDSLKELGSGETEEAYSSEAERLLGRLESDLKYLDVEEIMGQDLRAYLVGMLSACNRIGEEVHHAYFFT